MPELPGVDIEAGEVRTYPYTDVTAHVVSYNGRFRKRIKQNGFQCGDPGSRIGKNGIEKKYDLALRGEPGDLQRSPYARTRCARISAKGAAAGKDFEADDRYRPSANGAKTA